MLEKLNIINTIYSIEKVITGGFTYWDDEYNGLIYKGANGFVAETTHTLQSTTTNNCCLTLLANHVVLIKDGHYTQTRKPYIPSNYYYIDKEQIWMVAGVIKHSGKWYVVNTGKTSTLYNSGKNIMSGDNITLPTCVPKIIAQETGTYLSIYKVDGDGIELHNIHRSSKLTIHGEYYTLTSGNAHMLYHISTDNPIGVCDRLYNTIGSVALVKNNDSIDLYVSGVKIVSDENIRVRNDYFIYPISNTHNQLMYMDGSLVNVLPKEIGISSVFGTPDKFIIVTDDKMILNMKHEVLYKDIDNVKHLDGGYYIVYPKEGNSLVVEMIS